MANMDKVDNDLTNSAFLVYVTYRADSAPGTTLAGRATRLLLDEALGDYITNLWTVSTAICSPKAMLFERHATAEAILVVANTAEYSNLQGEERREYVNLLIEQVLPTVENILGMGYRLCIAGHNYAGQIAKLLAQQWNVDWITFLTPMPDDQRHMPRDYFVPGNNVPTNYVKSVGMLPVFDDLTKGDFKNFHAVTTDPDVSLPELRQLAVTRRQALERAEPAVHPEEEADVVVEDVDAAEAAMRNNEVRAVNQQQPMDVLDDVFGASNMNIGAPRMNEQDLPNNNVIHDNGLPADLNFNDIQPPEVSVSVPDGGVGIKTTTYTETTFVPPPGYVQKDQGFLGYLADIGATYERGITHQQGVGGQDISRTTVAPKYTTLPKNNNTPPKDTGLAAHEKLATTVLNVKPDEATVRIQQQTTVVTKKRRWYGGSKTTSETIRQGVREERTSTIESNIVNNTNKPPEYASTSKTEVVQHDHTDRNGNVTENLRGRTMKEQTLYARQDGKAYDTYSNTSNLDGSKVIKNEVDQQRSAVKQDSYDATNKLHKTLETENMHGTSNTTIIGPNTQTQTKKAGLVDQNVRQQQVVTQKENYIDQRKSTETDHSTGQSTTTESARANKRTAVGVESTQKTVSTANKTKGILTRKTIVKTKTERNYTKNNNNITYTNDQSQLKQVVIQEAPAAGAKGFFVTEKVKTTTHSDGKEVVKATQSLNLAAQQGLAVATAEMLDKTLDMIDLYKNGKLDKATVAASMATLFTNVGEGYFAGHAANLLTTMESHLDALGLSLVTVVGASLMRFGINWFASKSKTNKEGDSKSITKLSKKATLCIDVGGALARSGLYYVTLGAEFAFKSPVMFGASQIISAGQQVITALLSENMSLKDALVSVAPRVGISIASSLVSIAVQQGVTYCLGAALGGTVALSALTIVIPTLAFWATSKLLTKYLVGSAEEKELNRLLQLYKLDKNADISIIKKEYRRLCLEKHPDKGGSKEAFQALSADFDKITALHMLREAPKQDKNDAKKVSMFQTAYHKLRQVITYFRSKEISEKHIEPCFDRLDYEIQRASAEISGVKLEFFSQLTIEFEGLQEYEQKFKEKGYDNLTHLVLIVDDEIEFDKLCKACGIKDGHASQLRLVLRQLKNSNVPNGGAN